MSATGHSSADEPAEPRSARGATSAEPEGTVPIGGADSDAGPSRGLGDDDPHGFAAAFTGTMRSETEGAHGRSGRTIAIGAGVVAAIAVGAVVVGALGAGSKGPATGSAALDAGGPHSTNSSTPAKPAATQSAHGATRSGSTPAGVAASAASSPATKAAGPSASASASSRAVKANSQGLAAAAGTSYILEGPGCTSPGNWYNQYTYYTGTNANGTTGWSTQNGGYSGNGCDGEYMSMPLSGDSSETEHVLWKFSTVPVGEPCTIEVYIPATSDLALAGGDSAQYSYSLDGATAETPFEIDQVADRGRWVAEATVQTSTGEVEVRLGNAGADYDSSNWNAHDAVAAVALACTKS